MTMEPDSTLYNALNKAAFNSTTDFFDTDVYSRRDVIEDQNVHPNVEADLRDMRTYGPGYGIAAALILTNQVQIAASPDGGVRVTYSFGSGGPVTLESETHPGRPSVRNRVNSAALAARPEAHPLLTLCESLLHADLYPYARKSLADFARYVRYPITERDLTELSKREAQGGFRNLLHRVSDYTFEDSLGHIISGQTRIQLVDTLSGIHAFKPLNSGQIAALLGLTGGASDTGNNEARLARAFRMGVNALLVGPPATLKTSAVKDIAVQAGCWLINMRGTPSTEDRDFIGAIMPSEKGPRWVDGPLARAFTLAAQAKGIILIDEVLRYQPDTMSSLITVMDELSYTEARLILEAPLRRKGAGLLSESEREAADVDAAVNAVVEQIIAENLPHRDQRYYMLELPNSEILFAPSGNISFMLTTNWGEDHSQVADNLDGALRSRIQMVLEFTRPNPDKAMRIYEEAAQGIGQLVQLATSIDDLFTSEMQDDECLFDRSTDLRKIKAFIQDARACLDEGANLRAAATEAARTVLLSHVCPRDVRGNIELPSQQRFEAIIEEALASCGL